MSTSRGQAESLIIAAIVCSIGLTRIEFGQAALSPKQDSISEIEQSLPVDSILRQELEAGVRGDGKRRPYMDQMRAAGVKRAIIVVYRPPAADAQPKLEVTDLNLYGSYDCWNSEITDPVALRKFEQSGLVKNLKDAALNEAPRSSWYTRGEYFIPINLYDDEKMPELIYDRAAQHVRDVASQAKSSDIKELVNHGAIGLGVCHNWMSSMQHFGIRQARLTYTITFNRTGGPEKLRLKEIQYFRNYSDMGSKISGDALKAIEDSGLSTELERLGTKLALNGSWTDLPRAKASPFQGGATIDFFDDPWLSSERPPLFYASNSSDTEN